jgi:hypothetical protein
MQKGAEGRPPQYVSSNSLNPEGNRMDGIAIGAAKTTDYTSEGFRVEGRSPKTLREALAQGTTSITHYVDHTVPAPIDTTDMNESNEQGYHENSPDSSPFLEQEDSLHSTSERNYMDNIYDMGRSRFASKNSFQEVSYLSSLSSATFSNQSIVSSFNEDPRKGVTNVSTRQFALRVDDATEATNPPGSELPSTMSPGPSMRSTHTAMSPGPSMRSTHSMAQSIISVSPRGDTPKYNPDTSKYNHEFHYLMNSPSRQSGVDAEPSEPSEPSDHKIESPAKQSGEVEDPSEPTDCAMKSPLKQSGLDAVHPSEAISNQVVQPSSQKADNAVLPDKPEVNQGQVSTKFKQTILLTRSSCSATSSSPPGKLSW